MATIDPRYLDQLAATYTRTYGSIVDNAERVAAAAWLDFGAFNEDAEEEWIALYWLIISGAARAISLLVNAYVEAQLNYLGVASRVDVPDVTPLLRDQFDNWAISPMIRARSLIADGIEPPLAISGATARTSLLVNSALRVTEQETRHQLFETHSQLPSYRYVGTRPDIHIPMPLTPQGTVQTVQVLNDQGYRLAERGAGELKWKRESRPGACGWCQVMSARLLSEKSRQKDVGWHTHCRCEWRMVSTREAADWVDIYAGGKWKDIIDERFEPEEGVAVNA